MSEIGETTPTKTRVHRNRTKRRLSRSRLPTPPPDPMASEEVLHPPASPTKDAHFLEYINFLQKSPNMLHFTRSDSVFTPAAVTEDAFEHLERLYKLMEQMLNLRQQNARLQRRVRDLEHLKNLQSLHRQLDNAVAFEDIPELEDDSSLTESLLDTMLISTKKEGKTKPWTRSRIRQSLMRRQRNRSSSLIDKPPMVDLENHQNRRRSTAGNKREQQSKVSKWTKVKAAFRWEKAAPSVSGAKSQDSGISGMQIPVNYEVTHYLRVPSTSDEVGISPTDSGAADGSTPGTLSSASSVEDVNRHGHQNDLQIYDDDKQSLTFDDIRSGRDSRENTLHKPLVKMRNSSLECAPEKHRLSVRSDDIKIDLSDNEDLKTSPLDEKIEPKLARSPNKSGENQEIPEDVIARYRQAVAEDENGKQSFTPKRASKWTRVKKAFLTPSATSFDNKHEPNQPSGHLTSGKDVHLYKHNDETRLVQDEIQKNYRQLQKKLSMEFRDKLKEWEKLKSSNPNSTSGVHTRNDNVTDIEHPNQAFMKKMEEWQRIKSQPCKSGQNIQMLSEGNLAPEFKKKLEEWQKIKKYSAKDDSAPVPKSKKKLGEWPKWKSVSGPREEHPHLENQPLSDEFLKKLEEWRRIKDANKHCDIKDKTPSPKLGRKHITQPSGPEQHDPKELHWFEKELNKIEREKQRLEQERQKFLQREERLTKLRRAVMGGNENKKDVLVHTPSGFYRFEGISRKFTQKLCEWEKAQGIGPEASTFALLTSNFTPHITVDLYDTDSQVPTAQYGNTKLLRSKSAESLAVSNAVQAGPSTSHHPSSLSLNDVDELEKQCLALSRESSVQDLDGSLDKLDEPEAVIVEVEDVVEETASPLEERLEEKHFPVYQREMSLNTYEEKSLVVPCIQRVTSKCAQFNHVLIEDIARILKAIEENENQPDETAYSTINWWEIDTQDNQESNKELPQPDLLNLKDKNEVQKHRSNAVYEKLIYLQEAHSKNILSITEFEHNSMHFSNLLEAAQDSFSELLQMAEQLQTLLHNRCGENVYEVKFAEFSYSDVKAITSELSAKLSELKRILSYLYATSDMTAPGKKVKGGKKPKTGSKNEASLNPQDHEAQNETGKLAAKRLRYRKKDYCNKTLNESEDSDSNERNCNTKERKVNSAVTKEKLEIVTIDPVIVEKLVIPTKTNFVNATCKSPCVTEKGPIEIFVKTTRKLFTPVIEVHTGSIPSQSPSCSVIDLTEEEEKTASEKQPEEQAHPLPLPASPKPQRKTSKDISPSIRLMLAKYNQMISGQENPRPSQSAGNSGSVSPVAWRSPISERRVKVQTERYLQEVMKSSSNNEVKKSASISVLNSERRAATPQCGKLENIASTDERNFAKGILRSTSASTIQAKSDTDKQYPLKLVMPKDKQMHPSEVRHSKLQKAKEKFLNSPTTPIPGPSSAPPIFSKSHDISHYPARSRFSQISMGSESSYDSTAYEGLLVKSASAGMINIDEDTYKKIDPAFHRDGYVSLPRSVQKQKEGFLGGKLALSNIAAKFRKVKMRRSKDAKKMNTVSALCRQSLVVDINSDAQEAVSVENQARRESLVVPSDQKASSSEDTSPSSSRSGSWIRRSRIFKAL